MWFIEDFVINHYGFMTLYIKYGLQYFGVKYFTKLVDHVILSNNMNFATLVNPTTNKKEKTKF